ncbi:Uncharacterised protein [Mycobacteroides abscessus subsp. abscessus]|nr:Uncharacterised protein [Mycobacteroides abscessus subsp. abscessus]
MLYKACTGFPAARTRLSTLGIQFTGLRACRGESQIMSPGAQMV